MFVALLYDREYYTWRWHSNLINKLANYDAYIYRKFSVLPIVIGLFTSKLITYNGDPLSTRLVTSSQKHDIMFVKRNLDFRNPRWDGFNKKIDSDL